MILSGEQGEGGVRLRGHDDLSGSVAVDMREPSPLRADVFGGPWFVAQVKPNCLSLAVRNLRRQGFSIFAPTLEVTRRRGDAFKTAYAPLFPGYIFLSLGAEIVHWRSVNSTYGVGRVVSFGGAPAAVDGRFVDALRARCDAEGRILPEPAGPSFRVGEEVRVSVGPFANLVGQIEKMAADGRVTVLLGLLGGRTRVGVSAAHLERTA